MSTSKHHIPRSVVAEALHRRASWRLPLSTSLTCTEPKTGIERLVTPAEYKRGYALYFEQAQAEAQRRVEDEARRMAEDAEHERRVKYDATHPWVVSYRTTGHEGEHEMPLQHTTEGAAIAYASQFFGEATQTSDREWAWTRKDGTTGFFWLFSLDPYEGEFDDDTLGVDPRAVLDLV